MRAASSRSAATSDHPARLPTGSRRRPPTARRRRTADGSRPEARAESAFPLSLRPSSWRSPRTLPPQTEDYDMPRHRDRAGDEHDVTEGADPAKRLEKIQMQEYIATHIPHAGRHARLAPPQAYGKQADATKKPPPSTKP